MALKRSYRPPTPLWGGPSARLHCVLSGESKSGARGNPTVPIRAAFLRNAVEKRPLLLEERLARSAKLGRRGIQELPASSDRADEEPESTRLRGGFPSGRRQSHQSESAPGRSGPTPASPLDEPKTEQPHGYSRQAHLDSIAQAPWPARLGPNPRLLRRAATLSRTGRQGARCSPRGLHPRSSQPSLSALNRCGATSSRNGPALPSDPTAVCSSSA